MHLFKRLISHFEILLFSILFSSDSEFTQASNPHVACWIPEFKSQTFTHENSRVTAVGEKCLWGRNKGSSWGNTFILHASMLSTGHISSGINFCDIYVQCATVGWYGWRADQLIWSVILYSCEIKRTGRDYNRHRKNGELQKWKRWKPTEIISPAPTCTESIFRGQLVLFFCSRLSRDMVMEHNIHIVQRRNEQHFWWCNELI